MNCPYQDKNQHLIKRCICSYSYCLDNLNSNMNRANPREKNRATNDFQLADKCLYQAKSEGKNRVLLHQYRCLSDKTKNVVNVDFKSSALS